MAPQTPKLVVPIDLKEKPWEQKLVLHNRWHPEIPSVAEVKVNELFRVEMIDWTGGLIKDDDSATDVRTIDLSKVSINCIQVKNYEILIKRSYHNYQV